LTAGTIEKAAQSTKKLIGRKKVQCPKNCGKNIRLNNLEIHIKYCKTPEFQQ
jgi:hypothetical protein